MKDLNMFIDVFVTGDLFLLVLMLLIIILFVLIMGLFKTIRENNSIKNNNTKNNIIKENNEESILNEIVAKSEDDKVSVSEPIIKKVNIPTIETYDDEIANYENSEEENAVISAEELAKRKEERLKELGSTDSQAIIQKYEEEQEKKAIISYEQLVKNASNITLTYKEEEMKKGAPKVNKIEVEEKEVTPAESYIDEEEFLKILKEFRLTLE
jgi:hypothetical protein